MIEEWRPLPDFEGLYEISSEGRVRSLYFDPPRVLSQSTDRDGYPTIALTKGGKRGARVVHRLVCRTFHGEPTILHNEAAHLDGNRKNARARNLKWVSKVENHSHRLLHGTDHRGSHHPQALLTEEMVRAILARLAGGESCPLIAEAFNVSPYTISGISRRKTWRHVRGPDAAYTPRRAPTTHKGQRSGKRGFRLPAETLEQIAAKMALGGTCRGVAAEFGTSKATVSRIARHRPKGQVPTS